jgi:uncharacterized protein involved in response to NO
MSAESSGRRFSLFAYGFRPFFLAAGAYAVVVMTAWLWFLLEGTGVPGVMPPHLWHGHEMLFGFIGAAIAGFLLTAVPSWTGTRGFGGWPLIGLVLAWLAGRVAFALDASLPAPLLAAGELIFVPCLVLLLAPPLLRARNRNTPLLAVLAVFWLVDAAFLAGVARQDPVLASTALRAGINLVLLLVTVIGGRIVPAFTANALRARGSATDVRTHVWLERLVIGSMVLVAVADVAGPFSKMSGVVAAFAAALHAWRMAGWRTARTWREPIVWVLHAAYAWLPLGLGLKAVFLTTTAAWAAQWLHALTIGAAATMILAVMTRAALGHTGRPLHVSRPVVFAYALMMLGAAVRVFGSVLLPQQVSFWALTAAGLLWIAAFASFVVVYAPILTGPRADGRPG